MRDQSVDELIILKRMLIKQGLELRIEFKWLRIGSRVGSSEHGNEHSG
jgi:hypothetical protein